MGLQVRLIGPLQVVRAGVDITPSSGRLRGLIALLALTPGRPVSMERLVDALWGDDPPSSPRGALATYVGRLRSRIGDEAITTGASGYALDLDPDDVDVALLGRLVGRARAAQARGAHPEEERLLRQATNLWRGTPLAGVDLPDVAMQEAPRLEECYLAASERLADIDVAAGRFDRPLELLTELVAAWPLRESLWVRLLRLLNTVGRRAEALERYERARLLIADQLGSDPSAELQDVYAELLAERVRRPAAGAGAATSVNTDVGRPPQQLPRDRPELVGRADGLARLDHVSAEGGVGVITGPPGVGKTALAQHWGHRNATRFPDGQLYIDLRGFDREGRVMTPASALRTLIAGLAPHDDLPATDEGLAARWRSLTADSCLLVVLDNARDSEQVRLLVPAGQRCFTLVTSRSSLSGLIASEDASAIPLEPLSTADAARLLATRIGRSRGDVDPEAVGRLASCCSGLPLAVTLIAARAASQPHLPLDAILAELAAAPDDLELFRGDVDGADLRAAFSSSWHALPPSAARCFRLLGLHPGPDVSLIAAASLVGEPPGRTRALMGELVRAHLVREHRPGRYVMHDLLRAYAAELASAAGVGDENDEATRRMVEHYLHTGREGAAHLLGSTEVLLPVAPLGRSSVRTPLRDRHEALDWFRTEWSVVAELVEIAAHRSSRRELVPRLVQTISAYLELDGHWAAWDRCAALGLDAAIATNDTVAEAEVRIAAAGAAMYQGRTGEALTHLRARKRIIESREDEENLARVTYQIGLVLANHGDLPQALDVTFEAAERCRRVGNTRTEAMSCSNAAEMLMHLGRYDEALEMCDRARATWGDHRDVNVAGVWMTEGQIRLHRGEPELALGLLGRAADEYLGYGFAHLAVQALTLRGDACRATGDVGAARADWSRAMDAVVDPSSPAAAELRARLDSLDVGRVASGARGPG